MILLNLFTCKGTYMIDWVGALKIKSVRKNEREESSEPFRAQSKHKR